MTVWDSLGSSRVSSGLARQIRSGDACHAWLLIGPPGSGQRSTCLAMAAALNCRVEPGAGCGSCRDCARVLRMRHPDVHLIAPEGPLIPVDVIREQVIPEAARSPFEGARKVFILEEAESMNDAAQNALLKMVEEPQPDTVFILLSEDEEELLETLRSRCRIVRLEPTPHAAVVDVLRREEAPLTDAEVAARVSLGDIEAARDLAFGAAGKRRLAWAQLARRLTSSVAALDAAVEILEEARAAVKEREREQRSEVTELAEALGEGRGTATARNALAKRHRRELKHLEEGILGEALTHLASFYLDVVAVRRGARATVTNVDMLPELEAWAASPVLDKVLLLGAERCIAARGSFEQNANATLVMEAALVEVASLVCPPVEVPA